MAMGSVALKDLLSSGGGRVHGRAVLTGEGGREGGRAEGGCCGGMEVCSM